MCGSGYLTYPKYLPPTLNFFLQILKLEEIAEQNNFVLLFSSNFRIRRKIHTKSDHLKQKYKGRVTVWPFFGPRWIWLKFEYMVV